MREGKLRTIVRDKRFEEEMVELVHSVKRADEFLEGAEDILSHDPACGFQLDMSNVWFISGHTVDIVIYYTFNEDFVFLLSAERYAPPEL